MKLDEVKLKIKEHSETAPYFSKWRHLKSGRIYVVHMHVIREADLEPMVIYYYPTAHPSETWARPATEFFQKFVRVQELETL